MYPRKLSGRVICRYDYPIVQTTYGKIRGLCLDDIFVFRGVEYAQAKRFCAPEPTEIWHDIRDAIAYGQRCPAITKEAHDTQRIDPSFLLAENESCQNLNIWTPGINDGGSRPVLVWLHGGGWFGCSSIDQYIWDGEEMSRFGDIVFVSVNHRLHGLGYLDLTAYGETFADSGLAGFLDIVAALKWIRENISAFGGNPNNVTIMGQSGGVYKVLSLLQAPIADGYYHKAVIHSGGTNFMVPPSGWTKKECAQYLGKLTVEQLKLGKSEVHSIATLPLELLLPALTRAMDLFYRDTGVQYRWEPVADNIRLLATHKEVGFRQETINIPMLVGNTFGEEFSNYFLPPLITGKDDMTEDKSREWITKRFGSAAEAMISAFSEVYPQKSIADLAFMDVKVRPIMTELAEQRAKAGGSVFNWLFTEESSLKGGLTAWHGAELAYVFHNAAYTAATAASNQPDGINSLQDSMCAAWVAFMRSGNPSIDGLPTWPAISDRHVPTMIFCHNPQLKMDHDLILRREIHRQGIQR